VEEGGERAEGALDPRGWEDRHYRKTSCFRRWTFFSFPTAGGDFGCLDGFSPSKQGMDPTFFFVAACICWFRIFSPNFAISIT
jgi:hypothetical protein